MKSLSKGFVGLAILAMTGCSLGQQQQTSMPSNLTPSVAPVAAPISNTSEMLPTASQNNTQDAPVANNQASIPDPSGQWTYISDTSDGGKIYVDMVSGIKQGNIVRFWERKTEAAPVQGVKASFMYQSMSCTSRRWRLEKSVAIDSSGRVIGMYDKPDVPIQPVISGSVGEQVLNAVCSRNSQNPALASQAEQAEMARIAMENFTKGAKSSNEAILGALKAGIESSR